MKSSSRNIKYFDCKVEAFGVTKVYKNVGMPPRSMQELLELLKVYIAANPFLRENRAKTESWHIVEIDVDPANQRAVMLVNRSDRLAADQAISDPKVGEFHVAEKTGNQGNAYSAHIVFNLVPAAPDTYITMIEESVGISSSDVAVLLSRAARLLMRTKPAFFLCNDAAGAVDKKGKVIQHKVRYRLSFSGHPSPDFINQLNGGKIESLEVIDTPKVPTYWDGQNKGVIEKRHVVHLKPEVKNGTWYDTLRNVCQIADGKSMESVRVSFVDAEDLRHTLEFDSKSMKILNEERYVKKARIEDFDIRLDTGCKQIQPQIRDKMYALL